MRAGLYVRVSSQEQAEEGYSIGAQTERLKAYCKAKGWIVHYVYTDPGFTGSNTERPALNQLIKDIKKGKLDIVLVYKLDRLSRSQKDTLFLIEDVFLKNKVEFVSMNENFDTSTAFGRAMIGILSVFAQLEREQIKERTLMGRIERAKDGYFHGGGFDPIGYDYVDGCLVINDYEAMQVRKIYELFLAGWPITRIHKHMKDNYTNKYGSWHSYSSVISVLTLALYTGKIYYQDKVYEGRHESLIDEETFNRAQVRYEEIRWNKIGTKEKKSPFQSKHMLAGLLICGNCGARYFAKGAYSGRGENRYYRPYYTCYSRGKTNKNLIRDPDCKNKTYYYADLDNLIINKVKQLAYSPKDIQQIINANFIKDPVNEFEIIEAQIKDVDKQINRLLDLFQGGHVSVSILNERITKLNNQKDHLVNQLAEETTSPKVTVAQATDILKQTDKILGCNDAVVKRDFLKTLINKIVIDGEDITIHWAFL